MLKKLIFSGITVIFSLLLLEAGAQLLYRVGWGEFYIWKAQDALESIPTPRPRHQRRFLRRHILHPYVGFVLNTPRDASNQMSQDRDANRIHVALVGGSVAHSLRDDIEDALQERVKALEKPRAVQLDSYAVPGQKQPQQLMQLTFAYVLGKSYELVVNIDGYNEAVLTFKDNRRRGVSMAFPRLWDVYVRGFADDTYARELARVSIFRDWLVSVARWRESSMLARSAVVGIVVRALEDRLFESINQAMQEVRGKTPRLRLQSHGPKLHATREEDLRRFAVRLWHNGSRLLEQLVHDRQGRYYHFLQPNQYVPDSKPFSRDELVNALDPDSKPSVRRTNVRALYPMMLRAMRDQPLQYARFFDLTMMFSDQPQTLYIDRCCHFNKQGRTLLARKIVDLITRDLQTGPWPRGPAAAENR